MQSITHIKLEAMSAHSKQLLLLVLSFLIGRLALANGLDTTITIHIGGIEQVFEVKSNGNGQKPLLLYLHGAGPNAYSLIDNADKLTSNLQEHFTVVLWDQRGFGKTYALHQSPQPATIQVMVDDTKAVVDYILQTYQQQKLYIAGHSMGSVLGMYIAQQYPERVHALIEMCPPVHSIESQKVGMAMLKKHYKKTKNKQAIQELSAIKLPARDFESLYTRFIWQSDFDGNPIPDSIKTAIRPMLEAWMDTPAAQISKEVFEINFFKQFPILGCPVYFFVGRKDLMTNGTITEKYYKKIKAPSKALFWFEESGHALPDNEPDRMQEIIINSVLRQTLKQ
jgi:pimeloyl-ACP methyl ester carboxylesterase